MSELQPHLERSDAVRTPLPLEQRVAICLWRLGTRMEYRTNHSLFGVRFPRCAYMAMHDVSQASVKSLAAQYIAFKLDKEVRLSMDFHLSGVSSMHQCN